MPQFKITKMHQLGGLVGFNSPNAEYSFEIRQIGLRAEEAGETCFFYEIKPILELYGFNHPGQLVGLTFGARSNDVLEAFEQLKLEAEHQGGYVSSREDRG